MNPERELLQRSRFDSAIERLAQKCANEPWRASATPCSEHLTLDWILRNSTEVSQVLRAALRKKTFKFGNAKQSYVLMEKRRKLIQRSWPERIVEHVIAGILHELIQPNLSDAVYSFQRGLSNRDATREFATYIKETRRRDSPIYFA